MLKKEKDIVQFCFDIDVVFISLKTSSNTEKILK